MRLHSLGRPLSFVNLMLAVRFATTREIGLALPNELPKAHNLNRQGSFDALPVLNFVLREFRCVFSVYKALLSRLPSRSHWVC